MEEKTISHLGMVQAIVTRMASNSFLLKGWSVTLVSALFALAAQNTNKKFVLISYVAIFSFWILDGYFLYQERLFRKLYDAVRAKPGVSDFSMNTKAFIGGNETWIGSLVSKTIVIFYLVQLLVVSLVMFYF